MEYKTLSDIIGYRYAKNTFGFKYQFLFPQATKDLRTTKPFKTVHKEYLLMDQNSLVGNVGGIIAMFTGLSFLNCAEWLMVIIGNIWEWVKKKIRV